MTENRLTDFSTLALGEEGHTTTIAGEEDFAAHAATERMLQATTLPISEETTTFIGGEEVTTEALGEEGPTTTDGESPSVTDFSQKGGPFGAY